MDKELIPKYAKFYLNEIVPRGYNNFPRGVARMFFDLKISGVPHNLIRKYLDKYIEETK